MSALDHRADFASHHIEGYATAAVDRGQDGAFSVDLISQIDGNLWMGGCIGGVQLADTFRHVVSLYPWERYRLADGVHRIEVRLYDSADVPDGERLHELAAAVNACRDEGPTLVHCQAGLNRSGLITALALIQRGMVPAAAIALLREKRGPMVLCNTAFERWLLIGSGGGV